MYPSGLKVQAAFATVPPVDKFDLIHVFVPLKFSVNIVAFDDIVPPVAVSNCGVPHVTATGLAGVIVMAEGIAFIVAVTGVLTLEHVVAI